MPNRTQLDVVDKWITNRRIRRDLLLALLIAFGMLLAAVTACVGLLATSSAASLAAAGAIPLGIATVTGAAVAVRRRRQGARRTS